MRDYYEILGVDRNADGEAIKKAYRRLALQYHPDRNNGSREAEEHFKEATEAYEVLRDPQKRSSYDRFGHAGVRGSGAGGGFGGFDFAEALNIFMRDFGGFGLEDLFAGRGGSRGRSNRRGPDTRVDVPLTLQEVARGARKTIDVQVLEPCDRCTGTGSEGGAAPARCETCGGAGELRRVQNSFIGQLVSVAPCPACGGEGTRIATPCSKCGGRGLQSVEKQVAVEIPPGVSSGDYITLRGQGSAGPRGGPRGDLVVVMDVQEDPRFVRDGAHIVYELPITFSQAALGAEVEVPTVEGGARVQIPAGIQSGRMLRMRGRGLPRLRGQGRGDQIVRVVVWTPTKLSAEQEQLLRELARLERVPSPEEREEDRSFWSKVKEAFSV